MTELENAKKLYAYIVSYKRAHDGNTPTLRDMARHLEVTSTSHVNYLLKLLEGEGLISRTPGLKRSIEVTNGRWMLEAQP